MVGGREVLYINFILLPCQRTYQSAVEQKKYCHMQAMLKGLAAQKTSVQLCIITTVIMKTLTTRARICVAVFRIMCERAHYGVWFVCVCVFVRVRARVSILYP